MRVLLDYPSSKGNNFWDGKTHTIIPLELYELEINGRDLYLFYYEDLNLAKSPRHAAPMMQTILERRGNRWYKIPILDYKSPEYRRLVGRFYNDGRVSSINELPEHIFTNQIPVANLSNFLAGRTLSIPNPPSPPKYESRRSREIFRDENNLYYWDRRGTNIIEGAPDSLGRINEDRTIIYGRDCDYFITPILLNIAREIMPPKHYPEKTRSIVQIFYDIATGYYFYDPEGKKRIENAPESLGTLSKDGNVIYSNGSCDYNVTRIRITIFHNIVDGNYYEDRECTRICYDWISWRGRISEVYFTKDKDLNNKPTDRIIYYDTETGQFYSDPNGRHPYVNGLRGLKIEDFEIVPIGTDYNKKTTHK